LKIPEFPSARQPHFHLRLYCMSVAPVLATSMSSGSPSLLRNCAEVARTDWFITVKPTRSGAAFLGGLRLLDGRIGAERIGRSADTARERPVIPFRPMSPLILSLVLALGAAVSFWLLDRYVIGCAKL
jgi:hypothetical protein